MNSPPRNDYAPKLAGERGADEAAKQERGGSGTEASTAAPTRQALRFYLRFLESSFRFHLNEAAKLPGQIEAVKAMLKKRRAAP